VGQAIESVALEAVSKILDEEASILTVYYGEDVPESEAAQLLEKLAQQYGALDLEMHYGGQPLYYYVISVE
jgi:hypothetical protein